MENNIYIFYIILLLSLDNCFFIFSVSFFILKKSSGINSSHSTRFATHDEKCGYWIFGSPIL